MKVRFITTIIAAIGLAAMSVSSQAAKKHHHSAHKASAAQSARAKHLARLAEKKQAAWQSHLHKVHTLPRKERRAALRHDHRLAQLHNEHVAAAQKKALAAKRHAERLAKAERHHHAKPAVVAKKHESAAQSAHARHLAALQAHHDAALHAQHQAALQATKKHEAAQAKAGHLARLAKLQAEHHAHVAKLQAEHRARLAKLQAAHSARLAAQRAHWVASSGVGAASRSIRFRQTVADHIPVKVITVNLNDHNVKISGVLAQRGDGTSEPFRNMIARTQPNVAVTGTFFSLDNLEPVGDIVIDGSLVHFGGMGTALCITPDNRARMVTCTWGRHHDWSAYDFVCACGPRLLEHGRIVLDPAAERFHDRHMLAPNSRIAVGITPGNKIVFAMTRKAISLGRLAKVMRALGASEAMNLDAGTSTGFYYNGATLARPGRKLTNAIVVYGRRARYEHALDQLVPASYRHTDNAQSQISKRPSAKVEHAPSLDFVQD